MRCKLLLDENLPPRQKFTRLNKRFDVRHVVHDYRRGGISDSDIFLLAEKQGRIIITLNEKDFATRPRKNSGLIGLSPNLSAEDIDKKTTSLLTKHKRCFLIGKFVHIKK